MKWALATLAASVLMASASGASAATPQSRHQAERNLLTATRMLARWHLNLVDPKTGLVRAKTTASCVGKGKHLPRGYYDFTCTLRHRGTVVRLVYISLGRKSFEVRRLPRS